MKTQFAKVGSSSVAYSVMGDGPVDLLLFLGEYLPVDALDEEPRYARCLRRLASIGRVVVFNRRGVGLSDPPDGPPTMDQQIEDAHAVLNAVGSIANVTMGWNTSTQSAIKFAAESPELTTALVIMNGTARMLEAPDYPIGFPESLMTDVADQTTSTDVSEFDFLTAFAPSIAHDERFRNWWDSAGNRAASPARSRQFWQLMLTTDARPFLDQVTAPTLVIHRKGLQNVSHGRYIAEHITGAKFVELPGSDLMWWIGDSDAILNEVEAFIGRVVGSAARAKRSLATVLFTDVVGSTERAVALGDRRWRDVLDTYHQLVRREIQRHGGNEVGTAGDGFVATFDMPADAVRCARAIAEGVHALEIDVRSGVHTGEIEVLGDDVAGIGVHIAARVQSAAIPGEVWVSRTVTDLVTGSGLSFEDRGEHELKGVPGRWNLFALTS